MAGGIQSAPSPALTADLRRFLGDDAVLVDAEAAPYERGYRYGSGRARAVVRPDSVEAVRRFMAYAATHGLGVVPQGANTGLVGGSTPGDSGEDIVLSTERLRRIENLDPVDRSATVQAGVRLSDLNAAAAAHGLWLPIDLGADPSVGGMVATNTGGTRQIRYGSMQRRLLGLEVVLADGEVFDDLRPLRKDNSGLDLKQLFVGSGGGMGVITRATVELAPQLRRTAVALLAPSSIAAIPEILHAVETRVGDLLTAFEGMSREALSAVVRARPNLVQPFTPDGLPPYVVLLELGSSELGRDLDLLLLDLVSELAEGAAPAIYDARIGSAEHFWALRHAISDSLRRDGHVIAFDIAVPRSVLPAFRADVVAQLDDRFPFLTVCDFGHWGDGGLHLNLVWSGSDPAEAVGLERRVRELVYEIVASHAGTFSAEHGVGPVNLEAYRRYTPPGRRQLSGAIKALLDPAGRLGRVELA